MATGHAVQALLREQEKTNGLLRRTAGFQAPLPVPEPELSEEELEPELDGDG